MSRIKSTNIWDDALNLGTAVLASIVGLCACDRDETTPSIPFNEHSFVRIEAGEYAVGAEGHERNPLRTVQLAAFEIATHETTNEQFARFVEATGYVTDAETSEYGKTFHEGLAEWEWETTEGATWRFPNGPAAGGIEDKMQHPVVQISWQDAVDYCKWAGGRLPTLDEWEVAARGGVSSRYPWGDSFEPSRANIWNGKDHTKDTGLDGFMLTAPVGTFPPNSIGLYDTIGNVFEFCSDDITHLYPGSRLRQRAGRGGSWWCSSESCDYFNLVDYGQMVEYGSFSNLGFRMARDVQRVEQAQ